MPYSQQHPISFIVLGEVMRNGGIYHIPVQWLHTTVNHRTVHCVRLTVKISMNFTRIDFKVPFGASHQYSVHSRIMVFCYVHTYRRHRAGSISWHGQLCSRLGARQLFGAYVHSDLPQFSDIWGLISGSMPRYPHTLRPVAFVTVFVCSRLYVFRFRIKKSLNERCLIGVSPFSSHQIP